MLPIHSSLRHCPASQGYCCEIIDPRRKFVFMLSRHSLLPNQMLPTYDSFNKPYSYHHHKDGDTATALDSTTISQLPFISTIHLDPSTPPTDQIKQGNSETTPNAYQIMSSLNFNSIRMMKIHEFEYES